MNWYIGQEIICVKSHSSGMVIKDRTYLIKGLRTSSCACNAVHIDVGVICSDDGHLYCPRCGWRGPVEKGPNTWWFGEILFAPLLPSEMINELLESQLIKH